MSRSMEMYGCTSLDLDEMIEESTNPYMGGHYMLAMSILSDAQERIRVGHDDIARQYINRAKYVLREWNYGDKNE